MVFGSDDLAAIVALHEYAWSPAPKIFGILVWICGCVLLLRKLRWGHFVGTERHPRLLVEIAWLLGILVIVWPGSMLASRVPEISSAPTLKTLWFEFKGPASSLATWLTAVLGALALISDRERSAGSVRWSLELPLLGLVVTVTAFAVAELWTGRAWASEMRGLFIASRASSTLFNPNVLGLWASFTLVGVALLNNEGSLSTVATRVLCVLLAIVTLASGSRSAFVLVIAAMAILICGLWLDSPAAGLRMAKTGLTWVIALAAISLSPHVLMFFGGYGNLLESLIRNADRLVGSFGMIARYLIPETIVSHAEWAVLPNDGLLALDGRFPQPPDWSGSDNDYLSIAADGRPVVLTVWLSIWSLALLRAIRGLWRTRHRFFVYGAGLIVLSALAGMGMRTTQVFPVSLFVAITLAWALFWISHSESTTVMSLKQGH